MGRSRRKPTENLRAYDYYLRGVSCLYKYSKEANEQGLKLFLKAIEIDPDFASAFAHAANCYVQRKANGWSIDRISDAKQADLFARKAWSRPKMIRWSSHTVAWHLLTSQGIWQ